VTCPRELKEKNVEVVVTILKLIDFKYKKIKNINEIENKLIFNAIRTSKKIGKETWVLKFKTEFIRQFAEKLYGIKASPVRDEWEKRLRGFQFMSISPAMSRGTSVN